MPCGADVARSRGLGGSDGARESRSKTGHSTKDSDVKIQSDTTFISVLYNEDPSPRSIAFSSSVKSLVVAALGLQLTQKSKVARSKA